MMSIVMLIAFFVLPAYMLYYLYSLAHIWKKRYQNDYHDTHVKFMETLFKKIIKRPNMGNVTEPKLEKLLYHYFN